MERRTITMNDSLPSDASVATAQFTEDSQESSKVFS